MPMTGKELGEYTALVHELSSLKQEYSYTHSERIGRRIKAVEEQIDKIDDFIESVPAARVRNALSLRYRRNKSWQYIAMSMGGYTGADAPRKMCSRWMESLKDPMNNRSVCSETPD